MQTSIKVYISTLASCFKLCKSCIQVYIYICSQVYLVKYIAISCNSCQVPISSVVSNIFCDVAATDIKYLVLATVTQSCFKAEYPVSSCTHFLQYIHIYLLASC